MFLLREIQVAEQVVRFRQARVRERSARGAQVGVQRPVERLARLVEVALLQVRDAGRQVRVGLRNHARRRVLGGRLRGGGGLGLL